LSSEKHGKDIRFAKVNVDVQSGLAHSSKITTLPTFRFFADGKVRVVLRGMQCPWLCVG
jgi:thioredoxin-like negative regulator of GroEL